MVTLLKRFAVFFLSLVLFCNFAVISAYAEAVPSVSAKSAIVINADTNEVVYEKNAYEQRGMASTTKIMTSVLALECGDLSKSIIAKDEDVRIEGTSIGLKPGDKITLETLVSGMLLESGNDAANVVASAVGGTREKFVSLMNKKAIEIGMKNTSFKNPSGLTEDGHYSTAYDMALLGSYAIKNQKFRNICSLQSLRVSYGTPSQQRTFSNHNKLLNTVDGAFGIKTGFTKASGRCLVSAAERNGVTLVAVTLFAPDDWNDHKKLFEYGFSMISAYEVNFDAHNIQIDVVGSDNKSIKVRLQKPLCYTARQKKQTNITVLCEHFLYSGISKGDVVGLVRVCSEDGSILCESKLISAENAKRNFTEKEKSKSFLERIKEFLFRQKR